jgi:hypothetical protein
MKLRIIFYFILFVITLSGCENFHKKLLELFIDVNSIVNDNYNSLEYYPKEF